MKSGGGKAKGAQFERDVCKRLSLWISQGTRDDLLWRSAMSGGRATLQFKTDKTNITQSGDVSAVGRGGFELIERYFIEIKRYADLNLEQGFLKNTGNLYSFWERANSEALKYRKYPVLIAKQDRFPTIAVVRQLDPLFSHMDPLFTLLRWEANVFNFDEVVCTDSPSILSEEVWKPIPGFVQHFVSSLGRVRYLDRIIEPSLSDPRSISLSEPGRPRVCEAIARLVLFSFVGLPPVGKPWACHLDDVVTNNTIWNVVWGSGNALDRYRNGKVDLKRKNERISEHHLRPENRLKSRLARVGRFWITDGITEKKSNMIPEGWRKGRLMDLVEHAKKMSVVGKCPHCGIETTIANLTRWHFDNCPRRLRRRAPLL